jgi:hypothetical protein
MDSLRNDIRNAARDPKFRPERICRYLLRIVDLIERSPVVEEVPLVSEEVPVIEEVPLVVSGKSKKSRR